MAFDVIGRTTAAAWCAISAAILELPAASVIKGNAVTLATRHLCLASHHPVLVRYPAVQHRYALPVNMDQGCTLPDNVEYGQQSYITGQEIKRHSRTSATTDTTYTSWTRRKTDHYLHGWSRFSSRRWRCRMSRRCIPTGCGRTPANHGPSNDRLSASPQYLTP